MFTKLILNCDNCVLKVKLNELRQCGSALWQCITKNLVFMQIKFSKELFDIQHSYKIISD